MNSVTIDHIEFVVKGRFPRTVRVREEWDADVLNPESIIENLDNIGVKADLFTFIQRLPETAPKYAYFMEWHNIAALPLSTYEQWWEKQITQESRNKVRKAIKKQVAIRVADFDEEFVRGISGIYNETPIRQGKPFPHYGKDLTTLRETHATYLDRSIFLCAYLGEEMIGFIKLVHAGRFIRTMEILSKIKHRDKAPTNGLLAKAVEVCIERKVPYLVYGQFEYGKKGSSSLALFKKDNGFQKILLPRYYIPLTSIGKIVLKIKLQNGIVEVLPKSLVSQLLEMRKKWYSKKYA